MIFSVLQLFPTGDPQGRMVACKQPTTLAAMEGLYTTQQGAPLHIMGQPDDTNRRIDNPLSMPKMLSFLTYRHWNAEVKGLNAFPKDIGRTTFRCCITLTTSWWDWGRSSSP